MRESGLHPGYALRVIFPFSLREKGGDEGE
jgi:hypothetical protein